MKPNLDPIVSVRYKTDLISDLRSLKFCAQGAYENLEINLSGSVHCSYPENVQAKYLTEALVERLNDDLKVMIDREVFSIKNEITKLMEDV